MLEDVDILERYEIFVWNILIDRPHALSRIYFRDPKLQ